LLTSGPEVDLTNRILQRLNEHDLFPTVTWDHVIPDEPVINAWTIRERMTIVLPTGIIHFLEQSEGELAFVIAHEVGHLADQAFYGISNTGGLKLGQPGAGLGASLGTYGATANSRTCERRADEIGVQFIAAADYNPFDAAAFFGRLMMYQGQTGMLQNFFARFTSDHPIDQDRIADIRCMITGYCQQNPPACGLPSRP